MFTSLNKMFKYKILAPDGEIGKVEDFFFDERFNTIRYLVVNTGSFLFKNLVLISPIFVDAILDEEKLVKVSLTKEEIENSPDVDTQKPVSRVYERELFRYYRTTPYWSGFLSWGTVPVPLGLRPNMDIPESKGEPESDDEEHYLRSVNEVFGYKCETRDGKLGYIRDFYLNPETWRIETFVLSTKHLSSGEEVDFDMRWIDRYSYPDKMAHLGIAIKELEHIEL
jgi:sporulation protein YlmC with PRC-barrel domain